jgi:hypothetical protein
MEKIFSLVDSEKLIHFVHRREDFRDRQELIEASEFLQLSSQTIRSGQSFQAHRHIPKQIAIGEITAQESWVVISGKVEASYFDLDDTFITSLILSPGDASVTLAGGHSYRVLEEALVYEFKTGPYLGVEFDKKFI